MSEKKANQREKVSFQVSALRKYFKRNCTAEQMERKIIRLLDEDFKKQKAPAPITKE
jgi:ParB family chromosome partitioning protein